MTSDGSRVVAVVRDLFFVARIRERRRTVLAGVESAQGPVLQSDREGTPWPS